jgi:hypothetical protein
MQSHVSASSKLANFRCAPCATRRIALQAHIAVGQYTSPTTSSTRRLICNRSSGRLRPRGSPTTMQPYDLLKRPGPPGQGLPVTRHCWYCVACPTVGQGGPHGPNGGPSQYRARGGSGKIGVADESEGKRYFPELQDRWPRNVRGVSR